MGRCKLPAQDNHRPAYHYPRGIKNAVQGYGKEVSKLPHHATDSCNRKPSKEATGTAEEGQRAMRQKLSEQRLHLQTDGWQLIERSVAEGLPETQKAVHSRCAMDCFLFPVPVVGCSGIGTG